MAEGTFATAINCMDGRTQVPAIEYMKETFGVDFVDMVTEAGVDGILAHGEYLAIDRIKKRVEISVHKHGSSAVLIVGHADCAGHPVGDDKHKDDIKKSVEVVHAWNLPAKVIGAWIGEDWKVEVITEKG